MSDLISGSVEKVLYHRPDNGYTVLHLLGSDRSVGKITVVGYFAGSLLGEQVRFEGGWQEHPQHGRQFFAKTHQLEERISTFSQSTWLTLFIEGIGPSFAQKLQDTFGEKLPEILENSPQQLSKVSGIGKERLRKILQSWEKHKSSHETFVFLTSHHVSMPVAFKIYKQYGQYAIKKVTANPYQLLQDIEGFYFHHAETLARALEIAKTDPRRVEAALHNVLQQGTQYGHCGMEQAALIHNTALLLEIEPSLVQVVLEDMLAEEKLIADSVKNTPCIFHPALWEQEKAIADYLQVFLASKKKINYAILEKTLAKEKQKEKLQLSTEQQDAIGIALQSNVFVLTGGPGVGKTTLMRLLVGVYANSKWSIGLCAPTGRAAKRLSEVTGLAAKTIHRFLEYDPYAKHFNYNADNPLSYQVVIIDEASMLDVPLCEALLQALSPTTRVIFVGDVDQLSSVGPGEVLRSLIESKKIPTVALKTIFRQQTTSQIIVNAHRVNQGLLPLQDEASAADFFWLRSTNEQAQQQKLITLVTERLPQKFGFDPKECIQVLTPTNQGLMGVSTLNKLLQQAINPPDANIPQLKHLEGYFRQGDKVLQIVNNYEKNIFNGDVGTIKAIDLRTKKMHILFDQQSIEYELKELDQLKLAYAMTVHKSQGSEYPAVVVVLSMTQKTLLQRNLLYTAITRGKACVVVLSDEAALNCAVRTNEVATRINKLEEWLLEKS
jgi:exodeoxyribonuclease V alpha subunit